MNNEPIGVVGVPVCGVCGGEGDQLHADVPDRLFRTPGTWSLRRCRVCRAVWLDPRPTDEDLGRTYCDYYTHGPESSEEATKDDRHGALHAAELGEARRRFGLAGEELEGTPAMRRLVAGWAGRRADSDYLAAHLPVQPNAQLLDVGCGDGRLLEHLRRLGWHVQGVEPDASAADAARRRGLQVTTGTLESAAFGPEEFAAVTMSHVIEHLADPRRTLREIRRVLRPGGSLVVITPNADSVLHSVFGRDWFPLDPPRHLLLHSSSSLDRLLREQGFVGRVRDSWRAANVTVAASLAFRRGRPYSMSVAPPRPTRVLAELGQQALAMSARALRGRGDELVAVTTRVDV
ncbi:MAG TPA: class I SAM-dependent methyltransferase [Acidimicrobiales bacterium]|nr:class I SAM-dependent methyltransferase [Acidimicrobiales bacterium]